MCEQSLRCARTYPLAVMDAAPGPYDGSDERRALLEATTPGILAAAARARHRLQDDWSALSFGFRYSGILSNQTQVDLELWSLRWLFP